MYSRKRFATHLERGIVVQGGVERISNSEIDGNLEEIVLKNNKASLELSSLLKDGLEAVE